MIDVAVVGAGKIGTKHARVLEGLPNARVTAVVDVDDERADELATTVDANPTDLETALAVDALYVCTPDDQHVEITHRAIESGCHTFVEKPLATTVEAADELVSAARDAGGVHCVGHILRYDARYHTLSDNIDTIGELCAVEVTRLVSRSRARRTGAVSGPAMRLGVHDFDLVQWLTGRSAVQVRATAEEGVLRAEGYDIPDVTTVHVQLEDGPWATFTLGFALPPGHPGSIVVLRIVGTDGVAEVDASGRDVSRWVENGGGYRDTDLWPEIDGRPAAAIARIDRAFISAIAAGDPTPVSYQAGRDAVAIARAAEHAANTDQAIRVE